MDNNTPTTELSVNELAEALYPTTKTNHRTTYAEIVQNRLAHAPFKAGYNSRNEEVEALLMVMDNLPKWLTEAANILDFKADQIGKESILSPKLNWYAEKITEIITQYNKTT